MVMISFTLAGQQFELSDADVRTRVAKHRPERIHQYWVDVDGTRWPVKQVVALATGLHNRDFPSQSSRRLLAKLGFTIGKGKDANVASTETTSSPRPVMLSPNPPLSPMAADAVLVGCVKSKRASGAPAKDLYTSDYFAKMRVYAESTGKPWFILSAKHGLVAPHDWLESDDCYLFNKSRDYRREWGLKVARQLEEAVGPLQGSVYDIHAGAAYVKAAEAHLHPTGAIIIDQLRGLPFGRRLSWYRQQPHAFTDDAVEIVAQLSDRSCRGRSAMS